MHDAELLAQIDDRLAFDAQVFPTLQDYTVALQQVEAPVHSDVTMMAWGRQSWWGRRSYQDKVNLIWTVVMLLLVFGGLVVVQFNLDGRG